MQYVKFYESGRFLDPFFDLVLIIIIGNEKALQCMDGIPGLVIGVSRGKGVTGQRKMFRRFVVMSQFVAGAGDSKVVLGYGVPDPSWKVLPSAEIDVGLRGEVGRFHGLERFNRLFEIAFLFVDLEEFVESVGCFIQTDEVRFVSELLPESFRLLELSDFEIERGGLIKALQLVIEIGGLQILPGFFIMMCGVFRSIQTLLT
jgi:hypothetical protein